MTSFNINGFVIGGTSSGSGKTTITLGLLRVLARRGMKVQPFKVGPDYIDTGWHTRVSGVASRNLDAFMLDDATLSDLFYHHAAHADVAVIEGVMGLYDGYGTDPHYCSTAGLAKAIGCPVILVVDGGAVSTSAAATVLGFQQFDPSISISGVILNNVNSDSHLELLTAAIETYCQIPVLGRLPVVKEISLPSRHLGLVTAEEHSQFDSQWDRLAEVMEQHIDIDKLLSISTITRGNFPQSLCPDAFRHSGDKLTLALAYDEAFNFYYQDNLDLIASMGCDIVRFSPLHDRQLPDCDLVYLGGGFPELYAKKLSNNASMLGSILTAHQLGKPIYAECGGLMYLGCSLTDKEGISHPMVGLFPGHSVMTDTLKRFGYSQACLNQDLLIGPKNTIVRGHEFHYSDFISDLKPVFSMSKERDGVALQRWQAGYQIDNTLASYLHIHFLQNPAMVASWFDHARRRK
jgi:cobyrinic acid a,c-diamide synthase